MSAAAPRVVVGPADTGAHLAADAVASSLARALEERGAAVLGIATGGSPQLLYRALGELVHQGGVRPLLLQGFLLDEYVGLPQGHPESYREVVRRDLLAHLPLPDSAVFGPDAHADDLKAACVAYEESLRGAGGVDVQVLGIGSNGHLAFNEPGADLEGRTHLVDLAPRTRRDNARFFGGAVDAVPHQALTQGLGTIMEARSVVLVAGGASKARAISAALEGPVSPDCPASVLQRHPDVTVVLDEAAAALLRGRRPRTPAAALQAWSPLRLIGPTPDGQRG